jgi:hypothetical protein
MPEAGLLFTSSLKIAAIQTQETGLVFLDWTNKYRFYFCPTRAVPVRIKHFLSNTVAGLLYVRVVNHTQE